MMGRKRGIHTSQDFGACVIKKKIINNGMFEDNVTSGQVEIYQLLWLATFIKPLYPLNPSTFELLC